MNNMRKGLLQAFFVRIKKSGSSACCWHYRASVSVLGAAGRSVVGFLGTEDLDDRTTVTAILGRVLEIDSIRQAVESEVRNLEGLRRHGHLEGAGRNRVLEGVADHSERTGEAPGLLTRVDDELAVHQGWIALAHLVLHVPGDHVGAVDLEAAGRRVPQTDLREVDHEIAVVGVVHTMRVVEAVHLSQVRVQDRLLAARDLVGERNRDPEAHAHERDDRHRTRCIRNGRHGSSSYPWIG